MNDVKPMSELKRRALLAKQRLRMGYWQNLEREREELSRRGEMDEREVSAMQKDKFLRDEMMATDAGRAAAEERLYAKVCAILESDADTVSPIGQLIDKKEYMRLDECGRQKYILRLSEKFRELSRRYYLERGAKSV